MDKKRRRVATVTSSSSSSSSSAAIQQQPPSLSNTSSQQHEGSTEKKLGDKGKHVASPTNPIELKSKDSTDISANLTDDANNPSKQHLHQLLDCGRAKTHVQPDGTIVITIRPRPPLPNNVIASILTHVTDHQTTLYQCSLVNRLFYTLTIPLLWKAPTFNNYRKLSLFLCCLLISPAPTSSVVSSSSSSSSGATSQPTTTLTLAHYIHELQLDGQYWTDRRLFLLIPYLTHLKRLCIHANTTSSITNTSFQYIPRYCQHLVSLHLNTSGLPVDSFSAMGQYCYRLAEFTYSGQQPLCPEWLNRLTPCPLERLTIRGSSHIQQQQQQQYAVNETLAPIIQRFNLLTHLKLENMAPGLARSLLLVLPFPPPPPPTATSTYVTPLTPSSHYQNSSYPYYGIQPITIPCYIPPLTSSRFFRPSSNPMPYHPNINNINNNNTMTVPYLGPRFYANGTSVPTTAITTNTNTNTVVYWPRLTHLTLDYCHEIDDRLLIDFLDSHRQLASIHLEGTRPLTDAVLHWMEHGLRHLTDLYFPKNAKITAGGIRDLILYGSAAGGAAASSTTSSSSSLTKIHLDGCQRIMACDFSEVWQPNDKRHRFWLDRHAMDKIRQWHRQQQQSNNDNDNDDDDDNDT